MGTASLLRLMGCGGSMVASPLKRSGLSPHELAEGRGRARVPVPSGPRPARVAMAAGEPSGRARPRSAASPPPRGTAVGGRGGQGRRSGRSSGQLGRGVLGCLRGSVQSPAVEELRRGWWVRGCPGEALARALGVVMSFPLLCGGGVRASWGQLKGSLGAGEQHGRSAGGHEEETTFRVLE